MTCQALTTRNHTCKNKNKFHGYCHVHYQQFMDPPTCCICLDKMTDTTNWKTTQCNHHFHSSCWDNVIKHASCVHFYKCPMCRTHIPKDFIHPNELETCIFHVLHYPNNDIITKQQYSIQINFSNEQKQRIHKRNLKFRPTFILNQIIDRYETKFDKLKKQQTKSNQYFVQMCYGKHATELFCVAEFPNTLIDYLFPPYSLVTNHFLPTFAEKIESLVMQLT